MVVRKSAGNFFDASHIRLINKSFAYCLKEGNLSTTGGSHLEHNKYVGQISTVMRFLTSQDSDLFAYFDKSRENPLKDNNVLKPILNNNHAPANKGKIRGQLAFEHVFRFCRRFKNITKNLGFHITFKTANQQDNILSTVATNIIVTTKSLYLYIPRSIPSTNKQVLFGESIMNN